MKPDCSIIIEILKLIKIRNTKEIYKLIYIDDMQYLLHSTENMLSIIKITKKFGYSVDTILEYRRLIYDDYRCDMICTFSDSTRIIYQNNDKLKLLSSSIYEYYIINDIHDGFQDIVIMPDEYIETLSLYNIIKEINTNINFSIQNDDIPVLLTILHDDQYWK